MQTVTLTKSAPTVDEGATTVLTLNTTGVPAGSQYAYTIGGVSAADVVGGALTGLVTIGFDGVGLIPVSLVADGRTEALAETLTVTVAGVSQSIAVNDTSKTPEITEVSYALTGSTNVSEGGTATFTLKTTGVAAGALVGYRISGTGSAAGLSATGTFTVDADGNAIISTAVPNNSTIGDTGGLTVELLNGRSDPVVATVVDTTPTTYSADAITAANAASGVLTINVAGTAAQAITLNTDQLTPTNGFVVNSTSSSINLTSAGLNDKITLTGNGNNTLNTGNGNDTVLVSGSGNNTVVTGAGDDTVTVTGTGTNRIEVGVGTDTVTGGAGADTIVMGTGALTTADVIDGGDGIDTLIVSGDGNEINATNVKNIENLVLNGTKVTFTSDAVLESFGSVQGSSATSELTVTVANNAVVDLSQVNLDGVKSITLNGTATGVTVVATSADLAAVGAFTRGSNVAAVNLETDVAGYKLFSAANDTAFAGGTKTVTASAQELIDNKSDLTGATLKVSGATSLADISALADAGLAATKTVTLSVTDLLTAANLPDQKAALTSANTLIQVTGTATVAQAAALHSNYGTQIAAYQAAASGNAGIAISDTPTAVAGGLTLSTGALVVSGANVATVSSITLTSGSGVPVAAAEKLALLASTKVSGTYTVTDSLSAITAAITSSTTLPALLSKAESVSLTAATRTATSTADAAELQLLGTKLAGGYDVALAVTTVDADVLTAVGGAVGASVTRVSAFGIPELDLLRARNVNVQVEKLSETAQNLALNSSKLGNVSSQIIVEGTASVQDAATIRGAIAALAAKTGATITDNATNSINSYNIADTKTAILAAANADVIKGADGVTVSGVLTLNEALTLQGLAGASATDRLTADELVYSITDDAAALATALGASSNAAAVAALAGATAVLTTGTATVAQAKLLGASYTPTGGSAAVQVDSYTITDTVVGLFTTATGTTPSTNSAALANATALSVTGALTVAQMDALQGVQTGLTGNATIFDNVYAIADTASAISGKAATYTTIATAFSSAATSITVASATGVTVGATITGTGIADGTKITGINGSVLSLSTATTGSSSGSYSITAVSELTAATAVTVVAPAAVTNIAGLLALDNARAAALKSGVSFSLTDTIDNISGNSALGSSTPAVVDFVKTASSITVTAGVADATLTKLDTLATRAGTKAYAVEITGLAGVSVNATTEIADLATSVIVNPVVSKFIVGTAASVAAVKATITAIGSAAAAKLEYSLTDSATNLLASADATVVRNAVNLVVDNDGNGNADVTAAQAVSLLALSGAAGTVTYSLVDSYNAIVAEAASVADGATVINVDNAFLTVDQYTTLLSRASATTTVSTTVSAEAIVDTASAVSAASAAVLGATSGVTLTDKGSLTFSVAQAVALTTTISGTTPTTSYDIATATDQPGDGAVQVRIVDTTANLIAAKLATTDAGKVFVLGSTGSYEVVASDTETLTAAKAATLLSIGTGGTVLTATYNLADASNALFSSGTTLVAAVAGAASVTVNEVTTSGSADATTEAEALIIFTANNNVTFDVIRTTAAAIDNKTGSVYDFAATLARAGRVVLTSADSVATVSEALNAAGSRPVEYELSDAVGTLASAANAVIVAGAKTLAISSGTASAANAASLAQHVAKFNGGTFAVTDGAGALITNRDAVKAAGGNVTVTGTASVNEFGSLKTALGAKLQTVTLGDTASAIADFIAGGATGAASIFTFTGSKVVNAAQAITLNGVDTTAALAGLTFSSGSTSATVTSAAGLAIGDVVSGTGIVVGTTISAINGTTLTLSAATTAASSGAYTVTQDVTDLVVQDTAAKLLALTNDSQVATYRVTDASVDLTTAKDLVTAFTTAKTEFAIATTAERFVKAFTFDTDGTTSGIQPDSVALAAIVDATSLTVDGLAITLGVKNASLTSGSRTTHNSQIVGTVEQLAAVPAALKAAAGYVVVDSVANLANSANAAVLSGAAGYVVKDSASAVATASLSLLSSFQKALGIEVDGPASAEQMTTIMGRTNVDNNVVYSLQDTASNLLDGSNGLLTFGGVRTGITVDGTASAVQAKALLAVRTSSHPVTVDVVTTAAAVDALSNGTFATDALALAGAKSITIDSDAATSGLQGTATAAQVFELAKQTANLSVNISDTAANLSTAIANTGTSAASLATLQKATLVSVTNGDAGTAATVAQAANLAKISVTGGYKVEGTAADLTNDALISESALAKASLVSISSGQTATVTQAQELTRVGNLERVATGQSDAGKLVMPIADSAKNLANNATATLLDSISTASGITVDYTAVLTAAEATALRALDTASTKLSLSSGGNNITNAKVTDDFAALTDTANASALAAVGTINVSGFVTVQTLNQIRTIGGTATSEAYTYSLEDNAAALLAAGVATVDGATAVKVTGVVSVQDMGLIEGRAANSNVNSVVTATSYAAVSGTAAQLFNGFGGALNTTVADKVDSIDLVGAATLAQVGSLSAAGFEGNYDVADTATILVNAINKVGSLGVLQAADSVGLSTGEVASVEQAKMINANLTNEAALTIRDTAANLSLAEYGTTVSAAAAVIVDASDAGLDGLVAGITTAKITYDFDTLAEIGQTGTGSQVEVINGKAGDIIDLAGITVWAASGSTPTSLVKDADGTLAAGEYVIQRGFYSVADGSWAESATGTDTRILIETGGTNNTDVNVNLGADEIIVIRGITTITPDAVNDVNTFVFG